jgi:MoaA/NifB/PqqE/SkfB family radical SAM enzyme
VARDALGIVSYFRASNPRVWLEFHTNGSGRTPAWWRRLAECIGDQGVLAFSIDGLEDTNSIYRRNTHWRLIERAFRAAIATGANVIWQYVVFRHNEHQVELARERARAEGFRRIVFRRTERFGPHQTLSYRDASGEVVLLERPRDAQWTNHVLDVLGPARVPSCEESNAHDDSVLLPEAEMIERFRHFLRLESQSIRCRYEEQRRIYVSAEGWVFPCCYLAHVYQKRNEAANWQFIDLWQRLNGEAHFSLRRRALEEILGEPLFHEVLPRSWGAPGFLSGKLVRCCVNCGVEVNAKQNLFG